MISCMTFTDFKNCNSLSMPSLFQTSVCCFFYIWQIMFLLVFILWYPPNFNLKFSFTDLKICDSPLLMSLLQICGCSWCCNFKKIRIFIWFLSNFSMLHECFTASCFIFIFLILSLFRLLSSSRWYDFYVICFVI